MPDTAVADFKPLSRTQMAARAAQEQLFAPIRVGRNEAALSAARP